MITYKNSEISEEYNVAKATVTRWVDNALDKKNNLQLTKINNKYKILRNEHNRAEIRRLSEEGVIYRNKFSRQKASAKSALTNLLSLEQTISLVHNLQSQSYIPAKLTTLADIAKVKQTYTNTSLKKGFYPELRSSQKLLNDFFYQLSLIHEGMAAGTKFNIIDFSYDVVGLHQDFVLKAKKDGILNKYYSIWPHESTKNVIIPETIRPDLIEETMFEVLDIEYDRLDSKFFEYKMQNNSSNVVLLNLEMAQFTDNLAQNLEKLTKALSKNDLLIVVGQLDEREQQRAQTDILVNSPAFTWIPRQLGIEVDKTDISAHFNEQTLAKELVMKLDKDYGVEFENDQANLEVLLDKGSEILLARFDLLGMEDILDFATDLEVNLSLLNINTERTHFLSVFRK